MTTRTFIRTYLPVIVALLLMGIIVAVNGQQSTEQYIPIGSSPGVSGEYSYLGEIVEVDMVNRMLTVEDADGRHTLRLTDATRIWLDRSRRNRSNLEGSYADCEVGRRVEIMHTHDDPTIAAWIKIEAR